MLIDEKYIESLPQAFKANFPAAFVFPAKQVPEGAAGGGDPGSLDASGKRGRGKT